MPERDSDWGEALRVLYFGDCGIVAAAATSYSYRVFLSPRLRSCPTPRRQSGINCADDRAASWILVRRRRSELWAARGTTSTASVWKCGPRVILDPISCKLRLTPKGTPAVPAPQSFTLSARTNAPIPRRC